VDVCRRGVPGEPRLGVSKVLDLGRDLRERIPRREDVQLMSGVDKVKNKAEELGGKGKEAVGDATDNRDLEAEGKADQVSGNLKQAGEKVKDVFK
jgi:uncharacterized protein YjbJ (UPF0337 family)